MARPKSVKKQAEEANRLQQELQGNPEESAPEKTQEPTNTPPEIVAEEKNLSQPDEEAEGVEPEAKSETDWQARFSGLKSSYDREVPKLRGELSTALSRTDGLSSELDELKIKFEQLAEKPESAEATPVVFTDEEREQYGEGYINMMEKVAEKSTSDIIRQLMDVQAELAQIKQGQERIQENIVVSDEEAFFNGMNEKVGGDWERINTSDEFLAFLDEPVPYSGENRLYFLREARANLDLAKVIGFFNDFKAVSEKNEPKLKPKSVPEELIVPDSSSGGEPPIPEKKVYSGLEVTEFYNDKRLGKYKGKEDEAKQIEVDIIAAGREGRITSSGKKMLA